VPPDCPHFDWSAVNRSATALGFSEEGFKRIALPLQTLADGFLTVAHCVSEVDPKMARVVPLIFNELKSELERLGATTLGRIPTANGSSRQPQQSV
jgi:hypothetical protein